MILDYVEFKSKLKMYKRFKKQHAKYCQMVKDIEEEMASIPSVFPETTIINGKVVPLPKTHGDPHQKELYRLGMIDLKAKYEKTRDEYSYKVKEIEEVLAMMDHDLQRDVIRVYVNKEGMEKIANEHGYSKNGYAYNLDKELAELFENIRIWNGTK